MLEDNKINLFETIAPPQPFINEAAQTIKPDSETYKLSLVPFIQNLLFGVIAGIKTVGLLITEIKTFPIAKELNLVNASKSMYSEAFSRYELELFRNIFCQLLNNTEFIEIPEINSLGRILLIDGSVFLGNRRNPCYRILCRDCACCKSKEGKKKPPKLSGGFCQT
ncbi:MAG: hypothetical protein C4B58_04365 [Deltaproteobacteria bacterium]|nr:MAG: hypothetical protein C4B58_04365 [Deltaproteobacteria bacterium]